VDSNGLRYFPDGNGQGLVQHFNAINVTGTAKTQLVEELFALSGTGPNPPGTGLATANYFNPVFRFGTTDGANNGTSYEIGSEGNWTNAGGFTNRGWYLWDRVALNTALWTGYGNYTTLNVGTTTTPYDLQIWGKVKLVNKLATAGVYGVPAIMATDRSVGATAAVASVSTYTVGAADGSFEVSANVLVTTSTVHNFTVECAYTDEGNTARVLTLQFSVLAGTLATAIANAAGAVPYEGVPLHIRCKASTVITISTQAAGTYTGVTYNVEGIIKAQA